MLLFALLILLEALEAHAIDVMPQGKFIKKSQSISENPTVQMYFDANKPPVVNVTPGRPTIVQFPSEVRACISASSLITVGYGDKTGKDQGSSEVTHDNWYSAVILNADGAAIQAQKANISQLLQMPATGVTCQLRVSSPDSTRTDAYTWETIGVKIEEPKNTYFVVYLLNPGQETTSGLPSESDLIKSNAKYFPISKSEKSMPEQSILDLYEFSKPIRYKHDSKTHFDDQKN